MPMNWMKNSFRAGLMIFFLAICLSAQDQQVRKDGIERLRSQIDRVVQRIEGEFGVAAKHLESGQEVTVNGTMYFPMASVFKVPVLVELMGQIKEGQMSLDDEVSLQAPDQHLGSGMLSDLDVPGITLSIRNLINMMMIISDNSATDILVTRVGPENVNRRLQSIGIEGMMVNRTCQELILEAVGADPDEFKGMDLEEVTQKYRKHFRENPETFENARGNFSQVLKDQSTPQAMNDLLEKIFKKEILDAGSCEHVLSVMLKCQTGVRRIKGDLPRGVQVAHKTGTIGGTVNDAGIITLPDDMGHVVLTIFSKDTKDKTSEIENAIAQIARFVYDYFYFTADRMSWN